MSRDFDKSKTSDHGAYLTLWVFSSPMAQLTSVYLPEVSWLTMEVRTCFGEASGSAELSGCSTYGMPPFRMDYRSGCMEQFAETRASRLDPV
eukprot:7689303-Ditylum_brightwellii.AAC.1